MFPLFGVVFILFGIGIAIHQYNKAGEFRAAKRRYQRARRTAVQGKGDPRQPSPREFLAELDNIPTPREYLEQLSEEES